MGVSIRSKRNLLPKEPTGDECNRRAQVPVGNGEIGYACWYPQMGGYVGKAIIIPLGGCFDVLVWHDGEFPFGEGSSDVARAPVRLHHCSSEQFISFGEFARSVIAGEPMRAGEIHFS